MTTSQKLLILSLLFIISCTHNKTTESTPPYVYKSDSQELYNSIIRADSLYWNAYNTCDMETQANFYADSLEFYHDKGGLTTSKQEVLNGIKNNICGKVTRELIPGSIEIYPIKNFGAVEMGLHKFHNKQEPNAASEPGRFIVIWQQLGDQWKMKRIISLH